MHAMRWQVLEDKPANAVDVLETALSAKQAVPEVKPVPPPTAVSQACRAATASA